MNFGRLTRTKSRGGKRGSLGLSLIGPEPEAGGVASPVPGDGASPAASCRVGSTRARPRRRVAAPARGPGQGITPPGNRAATGARQRHHTVIDRRGRPALAALAARRGAAPCGEVGKRPTHSRPGRALGCGRRSKWTRGDARPLTIVAAPRPPARTRADSATTSPPHAATLRLQRGWSAPHAATPRPQTWMVRGPRRD